MMQHFSTGSFVAGTIFGAVLVGSWFFRDNTDMALFTPTSSAATTTLSSTSQSGAVSIASQLSGPSVMVESVTIPPLGMWVAVREVNGRDLGNILGATRVIGPHSNVTVPLLRATEPGRSYAIELYRDDNGGTFDPSANSVYVDFDTGARVVAYFTTTE